jgi:hypothetical protein
MGYQPLCCLRSLGNENYFYYTRSLDNKQFYLIEYNGPVSGYYYLFVKYKFQRV